MTTKTIHRATAIENRKRGPSLDCYGADSLSLETARTKHVARDLCLAEGYELTEQFDYCAFVL